MALQRVCVSASAACALCLGQSDRARGAAASLRRSRNRLKDFKENAAVKVVNIHTTGATITEHQQLLF